MITNLAAAAAECETTTWTDVALLGVFVAGVLGFFWLRWR
jgi:hypothetical protein